jgi:hypothetical protein
MLNVGEAGVKTLSAQVFKRVDLTVFIGTLVARILMKTTLVV